MFLLLYGITLPDTVVKHLFNLSVVFGSNLTDFLLSSRGLIPSALGI